MGPEDYRRISNDERQKTMEINGGKEIDPEERKRLFDDYSCATLTRALQQFMPLPFFNSIGAKLICLVRHTIKLDIRQ